MAVSLKETSTIYVNVWRNGESSQRALSPHGKAQSDAAQCCNWFLEVVQGSSTGGKWLLLVLRDP